MNTIEIEKNNFAKFQTPSSELREACESLLSQKRILAMLEADLTRSGFAGSTKIPCLVYLCLTTRFFAKPVSLVIKGPSGSGKSFALNAALKFVPSVAYDSFSAMSEKALPYSGLNLEHRYLVIQEAAGLAKGEGRIFLRQLLSEGEIRYQTVQQGKDGLVGKELPPIKGPAGLLMTTTANGLHLEDESRLLSFHMDESLDRIREALLAGVMSSKNKEEPDFSKWHALHEYVGGQNLEVSVPFLETLVRLLPTTHFRVMRDFPQVVSLIKAHALLHQDSRDRDSEDKIIATHDDYGMVRFLVEECLAQGLEVAVPVRIREVVQSVQTLLDQRKDAHPLPFYEDREGVSQRQIADFLGRDQSVVSRNVNSAIQGGYLQNTNFGQGKLGNILIGERPLPNGYVLPTVEELSSGI